MALSFQDSEEVLELLAEAERAAKEKDLFAPKIVLIGGQAVNYWADRYRQKDDSLRYPFASKDIDFQGERAAVDWAARALNVSAQKPSKDHATEQTGKLCLKLRDGRDCEVDFLRISLPNEAEAVFNSSVPAPVRGAARNTVRVMHPLACMLSRIYNVVVLPQDYDTEHGRKQLEASISCLRYFVLELAAYSMREALNLVKEINRYAQGDRRARSIFRTHGYDPFDAIPHHESLGDKFVSEAYPRWKAKLDRTRESYVPPDHARRG